MERAANDSGIGYIYFYLSYLLLSQLNRTPAFQLLNPWHNLHSLNVMMLCGKMLYLPQRKPNTKESTASEFEYQLSRPSGNCLSIFFQSNHPLTKETRIMYRYHCGHRKSTPQLSITSSPTSGEAYKCKFIPQFTHERLKSAKLTVSKKKTGEYGLRFGFSKQTFSHFQ